MNTVCLRFLTTGCAFLVAAIGWLADVNAAKLPNVLWLVAEDINPNLGCYGDAYARTPELDRLAARGFRFQNCWSAAPVCAPARTALITGVYPTCIGGEHMRSEVRLPPGVRMFPELMREAGYYCSNNSKEDYNAVKPGKVWDESSRRAHWRNRAPGQPFFAVFNFESTHESRIRSRPHTLKHDPSQARLPAYHPDTPEVRHDWAQYYDNITQMDGEVALRLKEIEEAGLIDDTIIFFYGDNGSGMPRSKRWPYNSGLSVPLIIWVPEKFRELAPDGYMAGGVSSQLVSFVDFAPTMLSIAGRAAPSWMQGKAFMGSAKAPAQRYLYGFRGRMDERYDFVRSVRNDRYIYARNYRPDQIYGAFIAYMFETPTTRVWKDLFDRGQLRPPRTFFWQTKPPEELYDLETDRDEVRNLAGDPGHRAVMEELKRSLAAHIRSVRDTGFLTEAEQHRRAAGSTIYEMGHDPRKYDLEAVLEAAERASSLKPEDLPALKSGLRSSDPGVRYWAAMGLYMRGPAAVSSDRDQLKAALQDPVPSVRIAAALAFGHHGSAEEISSALQVLKELAPPDRNGAYTSVLALNAVLSLGDKARPIVTALKSMPMIDPAVPERANDFVHRLVKQLPPP